MGQRIDGDAIRFVSHGDLRGRSTNPCGLCRQLWRWNSIGHLDLLAGLGATVADVLNNGTKVVEGNGGQIKSALDELSKRCPPSDGGPQTREQIEMTDTVPSP